MSMERYIAAVNDLFGTQKNRISDAEVYEQKLEQHIPSVRNISIDAENRKKCQVSVFYYSALRNLCPLGKTFKMKVPAAEHPHWCTITNILGKISIKYTDDESRLLGGHDSSFSAEVNFNKSNNQFEFVVISEKYSETGVGSYIREIFSLIRSYLRVSEGGKRKGSDCYLTYNNEDYSKRTDILDNPRFRSAIDFYLKS